MNQLTSFVLEEGEIYIWENNKKENWWNFLENTHHGHIYKCFLTENDISSMITFLNLTPISSPNWPNTNYLAILHVSHGTNKECMWRIAFNKSDIICIDKIIDFNRNDFSEYITNIKLSEHTIKRYFWDDLDDCQYTDEDYDNEDNESIS